MTEQAALRAAILDLIQQWDDQSECDAESNIQSAQAFDQCAMQLRRDVLSMLDAEPERPQGKRTQHGYGCPHDGYDLVRPRPDDCVCDDEGETAASRGAEPESRAQEGCTWSEADDSRAARAAADRPDTPRLELEERLLLFAEHVEEKRPDAEFVLSLIHATRQECDRLRAALSVETTKASEAEAEADDLRDVLRARTDECDRLRTALKAITEDIEARWDMNHPSTNPGIKYCVKQARAALAEPPTP